MKRNLTLVSGISLFILFVLFTISLTCVDLQPIGPRGSWVAYASINKAIHTLFGTNMQLYHITDWTGMVTIFIALGFFFLGLSQWIQRKHILRVDSSILILGGFYVLVFSVYVFFEFCIINRRPILINGVLEASYPSSTTMLALCILSTAIMQFRRRIKKTIIRRTVICLCSLCMVFMVLGRLLCGAHWVTDLWGGILFSSSMILLYRSVNKLVRQTTPGSK